MDAVIRGLIVYLVLLIIFRISGKRSLAQTTPFDLVLTLIISESIQQAMIDNDNSITHALLLVLTLVGLDIVISIAKQRSSRLSRVIEGTPLILMRQGVSQPQHLRMERVDEADIMQSARGLTGACSRADIEYAVLEPSGQITIVPKGK